MGCARLCAVPGQHLEVSEQAQVNTPPKKIEWQAKTHVRVIPVVTLLRADTASTLMSAYTTTHHDKWQSYQRWKKLHAETCAISVENESTLKKCFNVGRRFQRWEHSTLQQFFNAANCLIAKLFSTLKRMIDVGKTFQHWNVFKLQNYVQRWTRTLGFKCFCI